MLQYPDLTLDDIRYYWGNSIVMLSREGTFVACSIAGINREKRYPIVLNSVITGEHVISVSLPAFIRRVLVHHPSLGYGDYHGLPLYLSPRAGANLRKGVDDSNLTALCPFDWKASVRESLNEITKRARTIVADGKSTLPVDLSMDYQRARNLYQSMQGLSQRGELSKGRIGVGDCKVTASVMEQCVNNRYPTVPDAVETLESNLKAHGISISRDFALLRTDTLRKNVTVYHRLTNVGTVSTQSCKFTVSKDLTTAAQQCVTLSFNRVLEK